MIAKPSSRESGGHHARRDECTLNTAKLAKLCEYSPKKRHQLTCLQPSTYYRAVHGSSLIYGSTGHLSKKDRKKMNTLSFPNELQCPNRHGNRGLGETKVLLYFEHFRRISCILKNTLGCQDSELYRMLWPITLPISSLILTQGCPSTWSNLMTIFSG